MRLRRGEVEQMRGCSAQAKSGATGAIDRVSGNFSSVKLGGENSADAGIKASVRRFKTRVPTVTSAAGTATSTLAGIPAVECWSLVTAMASSSQSQEENPQLPAVATAVTATDGAAVATVGSGAIAPVGELSYDPQLHQL